MLDLLPSTHELNNECNKRCNLIWKGKLACLLLFNEKRLSLGSIAGHFTETVCFLCKLRKCKSHKFLYISIFVLSSLFLDQFDKLS